MLKVSRLGTTVHVFVVSHFLSVSMCLFSNILGFNGQNNIRKEEPYLFSHPDNMTALVSAGFPTHTDLSPDWSEYHKIA